MRTCGIFSALLLAIIAVPALAISVLYNGIAQTILVSPSFVASLAPKSMNIRYRHVAPYLVQNALTDINSADSIAATLFPDATTRTTVQQILHQILTPPPATSSPVMTMSVFDTNLINVVTQTLGVMPPCTTAAETAIGTTLRQNQLPAFDCAPTSPALTQQIIDTTNQVLHQAFDNIIVSSQIFLYTSTDADMANQINSIRANAGQSIMFPATLIIMVVAFAVRSRRQLFGWISSIVLVATGIGILCIYGVSTSTAPMLEAFIIQEFTAQAGLLLPVVSAMNDSAFPEFLAWSMRTFLIMMGCGVIGVLIAIILPKPVVMKPRTSQPLGPQIPHLGDGSTNRVKTDYETDAFMTNPSNTLQLPPGLDTSKLTFGRRMPKIPQPTQQITDMIPSGDHTSPIPVDGQTETLDPDTQTQELGPKEDSRATQRTDEHRF
jgi:hypothetical protein